MFISGGPESSGALIKTLVAAIIGSGIGLAVKKLANKKVTWSTAILSFLIGIGLAYLFHSPIEQYVDETWQTAFIGALAIVGEKIGYWFVFKFNINKMLDGVVDSLYNKYKNKS
jgi:phosphate/sulfate permease